MQDDISDKKPSSSNIRVVVADASLMLRRAMARMVRKTSDIALLATTETTEETMDAVRRLFPHVLVMDLAGEGLDGLSVLRQLKAEQLRCAVVLFSAPTMTGAESTIRGMELGASDFVAKPVSGSFAVTLSVIEHELLPRLRALGNSTRGLTRQPLPSFPPPSAASAVEGIVRKARLSAPPRAPSQWESSFPTGVVVIASSTGGPDALMRLLPAIPADFPTPILVAQHMPPLFTATLATRLNQVTALRVLEALDGEPLLGGAVYVAPGDRHMIVGRDRLMLRVRLNSDPPVHSCRPAADVLFSSAAEIFGAGVLGIVLTGMGVDGTSGARAIREKGGRILVQTFESCLVNGMPKSVHDAGLANEQLSLSEIAARMRTHF
ncbi:MAG: chemotaxis-specific protein-glutamate methyltransferase CheB [Myxococcota bacterium]|jgi:two-component system chemotaxis response regulator CheB|nr:chemotaxis-specific protein-glutamate methyltransferase CheB [Myxococcota bacterium]